MVADDALTNDLMFYDVFRMFYDHFQTSGQCEAYTNAIPEFKDFFNHVSFWGSILGQCEACLTILAGCACYTAY